MTERQIVNVYPAAHEVAAIHLPAGSVARVHHPGSPVREVDPARAYGDASLPLIATVTGDCIAIGWGVVLCLYYAVRQVRNDRHRLDRAAWDDAVKAISKGGVAYVAYEQRDYGKPRWTATTARAAERAL